MRNTRQWPSGFYIYWKQGNVYDQYWSGYASWVISNGLILFVSTDGAVVALEAGNPASQSMAMPAVYSPALPEVTSDTSVAITDASDDAIVPYTEAASYVNQTRTVEGPIEVVFNNQKAVYLGFANPHHGVFVVRIMKDAWGNFEGPPEEIYAVGQRIRVTGHIDWYQSDPVIYVTHPKQIEILTAK